VSHRRCSAGLARSGTTYHTAEDAVRWLEKQFEYREAAIGCIEQAGQTVPLGLRRATAHQERLVVYEASGEKRARAVALGQIAELLADKGEVDQALKLHQERLAIVEALGDPDSIAHTLWSIAKIDLSEQQVEQAFEHLAASYEINLKLGRLEGICYVGLDFGHLFCASGHLEQGLAVLERSRDGFVKFGRPEKARYVQSIMNEIQSK
jgi:tetratricopeptide (TPR) repeat protein